MVLDDRPDVQPKDIDLVALAATVVQNRIYFFVVFGVVLLLGGAYAFLAPAKYEYVSLLRVADSQVDSGRKPLEPLEATRASIITEWLPALMTDYASETDDELPFEIKVDAPSGSALIRLVAVGSQEYGAMIEAAHKTLLEQTELHLSALREETEDNLQHELQSVQEMIVKLDGIADIADAYTLLLQQKSRLERVQRSLRPAEVRVVARQSPQRVGPNRLLIMAASFTAAVVMGIFSALFVRFARSVWSRLHDGEA